MKVKNRHRLKRKEILEVKEELMKSFSQEFFNENSSLESGIIEDIKFYFVDDEPAFMIFENKIVFTLHGLNVYKPREKVVVVDMGAVKFATNGADVMAPGIVDADNGIAEDDMVWICDERNRKPLAVGFALIDGDSMVSSHSGKAIRVFHFVGDKFWQFSAKSL